MENLPGTVFCEHRTKPKFPCVCGLAKIWWSSTSHTKKAERVAKELFVELLPDEVTRQDLVARGVGHLAQLDALGRSTVQGVEGGFPASEPQLKIIVQLREVEAAGWDDVAQGEGIVEIHKRVDARRFSAPQPPN